MNHRVMIKTHNIYEYLPRLLAVEFIQDLLVLDVRQHRLVLIAFAFEINRRLFQQLVRPVYLNRIKRHSRR